MLQIFSVAYGERHVRQFKETALWSLTQKENKQALQDCDAVWNVYTDDSFADDLYQTIVSLVPKIRVRMKSITDTRDYNDPIQSGFVRQIDECLETTSKCLMAPPDTVFGDGAVAGLLAAGIERGSCVAVPHVRTLPTILPHLRGRIKNDELVSLSMKHAHKAWTDAKVGHPRQNSYIGGIAWHEPKPGLYVVKHYLPTLYLCDFIPEDLEYFKVQNSFGIFDHTFPSAMVIPRGRQRTVGASDLAFICEITDTFKNIPPLVEGPRDGFWKNEMQHMHNKQLVTIFREAEVKDENPHETKAC